ncbi:MAG: Txe/YoeB family addiction module toxin [Candidatus Marinimicrobia bacterium]|nr:Txe/YoeB family addiction module toxin [Candidatus Neomarinimicrobiota bacterium]
MRVIIVDPNALDDLTWWTKNDKRTAQRIIKLIRISAKDPFSGIGKPEPLKYELRGAWSRRINQEHRLVYEVTEKSIRILACRYHY